MDEYTDFVVITGKSLAQATGGKLVEDGFDCADAFLGKFCLSTRAAGLTAANNDSRPLSFRLHYAIQLCESHFKSL
jgi:hypothetical protein